MYRSSSAAERAIAQACSNNGAACFASPAYISGTACGNRSSADIGPVGSASSTIRRSRASQPPARPACPALPRWKPIQKTQRAASAGMPPREVVLVGAVAQGHHPLVLAEQVCGDGQPLEILRGQPGFLVGGGEPGVFGDPVAAGQARSRVRQHHHGITSGSA